MIKFTANLSLLFTELDFLDRFQAAKECGFDAVEIQFPYLYSAKQIKQKLVENDLKLILFNVDADDLLKGGEGLAAVPEKQEMFSKALEKSYAYAKILTPQVINILPGRCFENERIGDYLTMFKKNLSLSLDTFSPLGIKTVFEAVNTKDMPNFIIHNSRQMLEIIEQLNHSMLYMQYDIYHMEMMDENSGLFIDQYSDKIGHIQFADVPGRGQPGTGDVNFKKLFSTIEKSDFSGWVGAEYNPVGASNQSVGWLRTIHGLI